MNDAQPGFSLTGALLVFAGGALGSLDRAFTAWVIPDTWGPTATLIVNLTGTLLLGVLIAGMPQLTAHGRLLIGTGFLGGFTTYSLLAADIADMLLTDRPVFAIAYASISLIGGLAAAVLGMALGRKIRP